jgi:hypothetical protein
MEPTMTFGPGIYYVGDPGFVLPNNALRMLFANSLHHMLKSGVVPILEPHPLENGVLITSFYWMAVTPHLAGTFYDQDNTGWGFDWGCFGLVPWEIVDLSRILRKSTKLSLPSHLSVHLPKTALQ